MSNDQLPLPGFPVRIIVSAIWAGPTVNATIRATVDAPSDDFSHQWIGTDTEGVMTGAELQSAMETMLGSVLDQWVLFVGATGDPSTDPAAHRQV